jgi:O-antigen/teichoic acid export membrane protein
VTAEPPRSARAARTARHLGIYGAGQLAQAALAFFLVAVLARALGREGFGQYSLTFVIASLGALVADFGLGPWLTRAAAQEPEHARRRLGDVLKLRTLLTTLSWALTLAGAALYLRGTTLLGAVAAMLAYLTLSGYVVVFESLLIGRGFVGRVTLSIVGGKALELLAVLAWLAGGRPARLTEVIAVLTLAGVLRLVLVWRLSAVALAPYRAPGTGSGPIASEPAAADTGAPVPAPALPLPVAGSMLAQVFPFALGAWMWMAYFRVDVLLLQRLATPVALGLYAAAYRVIEALLLVPRSVVGVTYPAASAAWREGTLTRGLLSRPGRMLALVSLAAAGGLWALAPETMTFLFGRPFVDGAAALRVLALALPVLFLNQYLGMLLPATHRQNAWVSLLGAALIVNVIANLVLIPRFGIAGAAGATLASECFTLVCYGWLVVRRHGWFLPPLWLLRVMVAAATMAWLVGLVPGAFPLRVLAGVALFVLLAALLRIVGAEDLALGGRVLRDRGARGATP